MQTSKTERQAFIVAMFDLVMRRGVSQNRAAQIIENKGMSKGVKRRYHEAKKNKSAVTLALIIGLPQNVVETWGRSENLVLCELESLIKEFKKLK